ncbi:amidohydrolase [Dehalococcoidia bacterium]|nr:amidohydrolase [Dehalococcoidia bacterium]
MRYKIISADDHLQEAPDTWTARMSKQKWGDNIPEVRPNGDGTDSWYIWNQRRDIAGGVATVHGAMPDRTNPPKRWEDVPEIAYVPAERVKAMDEDGVDAHTFFSNVGGVAGNTYSNPEFSDSEFRLECIQAYNDFQIDAWSDPFPGRFITLAVVPLWDPKGAVDEVHRMKQRGIHGISFAFPQQFGYPHVANKAWDPFWASAVETELPVNFHIGSGGSQGTAAISAVAPEGTHPMMLLAEGSTRAISANIQVMATLLFSGVMARHPQLNIVSAESGMGWVPYLLETADHQWDRQKLWRLDMEIKPSEYFRRQCYVTFWYELVGIELREYIGVDNMMWQSDFPHPTCTWPNSREYIERGIGQLPSDEQRKILCENVKGLYHLDKYEG